MTKIDKNVPLPKRSSGKKRTSVFWEMEVGDSVFLPNKKQNVVTAGLYRLSTKGRKFATRIWEQDGQTGVRVWRTA